MTWKIKIAIVASEDFFSDYGGGQVYVRNLVDELINRGEDVVVLSIDADPNNHTSKSPSEIVRWYKGIAVYQVLRNDTTKKQLTVLLQEIAPDIVHAHGYKKLFVKACHDLKIPCIVTVHHGGILCPQGALLTHKNEICRMPANVKTCLPCVLKNTRTGIYWWPLLRLLPVALRIKVGKKLSTMPFIPFLTPIYKTSFDISNKIKDWHVIKDKATLLISPSDAMAASLIRNGARSINVKVLPHGIPISNLVNQQIEKTNDSIVHFLYVGRLCREKGVHILLEAFSRFMKSENSGRAALHLIGGAVSKAEIRYWKRLKHKYQIYENVDVATQSGIYYLGKLTNEETQKRINNSDVLVHPTICLEVFGLNIAEALSLNKMVIATRCGGAEMQIEDGVNGWLIRPNSVDELLGVIQKVCNDPRIIQNKETRNFPKLLSIEEHTDQLLFEYYKLTQ